MERDPTDVVVQVTTDHHLGGVAMAELCIATAIHEDLRDLCRKAKTMQTQEIAMLRGWPRAWYGIEYVGDIPAMARQDLQRLSALSGAAFEIDFLQTFSHHHVQIIKLSRSVLPQLWHQPLRELARHHREPE